MFFNNASGHSGTYNQPPSGGSESYTITNDDHDMQGLLGSAYYDNTGAVRFGHDVSQNNFRDTVLYLENVNIPQGATVESFTLSWNQLGGSVLLQGGSTNSLDYRISMEASDNAALITNGTGMLALRSNLTTANAEEFGRVISEGVSGVVETLVDFAAPVQEVVSRPGWVSGNAMNLHLVGIDPCRGYVISTNNPTADTAWTISYSWTP